MRNSREYWVVRAELVLALLAVLGFAIAHSVTEKKLARAEAENAALRAALVEARR